MRVHHGGGGRREEGRGRDGMEETGIYYCKKKHKPYFYSSVLTWYAIHVFDAGVHKGVAKDHDTRKHAMIACPDFLNT